MEDFWRMVWDQNSSVIVMLSDVDEDVSNFECAFARQKMAYAIPPAS